MKILSTLMLVLLTLTEAMSQSVLTALRSPILFQGDKTTAFRDPAVLYYDNEFYLFFTLVEVENDGKVFSYTATSRSRDLQKWTRPEKITPRDQNLNYCSPGNVIRLQKKRGTSTKIRRSVSPGVRT